MLAQAGLPAEDRGAAGSAAEGGTSTEVLSRSACAWWGNCAVSDPPLWTDKIFNEKKSACAWWGNCPVSDPPLWTDKIFNEKKSACALWGNCPVSDLPCGQTRYPMRKSLRALGGGTVLSVTPLVDRQDIQGEKE